MLESANLDAVLIGAPDHQHVPLTVAAVNAGCDVYVEKPLTHAPAEAAVLTAALEGRDRVVQVGTQQRSVPHLVEARDLLRTGVLGRVVKVRDELEPQPARPRRGRAGRRPAVGGLAGVPGRRPAAAVRPVSIPALALVLGFRRGDLHRPDGALAGHRPLVPGPARPDRCGVGRSSLRQRRPVGNARHRADAGHVSRGGHEPRGGHESASSWGETGAGAGNSDAVQLHFEGTFANHTDRAMCEFQGERATLYVDRGRYRTDPPAPQRRGAAGEGRGAGAARSGLLPRGGRGEVSLGELGPTASAPAPRPRAPRRRGSPVPNVAHLANAALLG